MNDWNQEKKEEWTDWEVGTGKREIREKKRKEEREKTKTNESSRIMRKCFKRFGLENLGGEEIQKEEKVIESFLCLMEQQNFRVI